MAISAAQARLMLVVSVCPGGIHWLSGHLMRWECINMESGYGGF